MKSTKRKYLRSLWYERVYEKIIDVENDAKHTSPDVSQTTHHNPNHHNFEDQLDLIWAITQLTSCG